jgi:hypothetical protein
MAQSTYPSSPSSSPRNATAQLFATYQPTGTYTYNGTLAAGKYAITADIIDDGVGTNPGVPINYTFTGSGNVSGTFSSTGAPVYFYASTPSTLSITGGTIPTVTYPYTSATARPVLNNAPAIASITPRYYSATSGANATNQLLSGNGSNGQGYILTKDGRLISFSNSQGVITIENNLTVIDTSENPLNASSVVPTQIVSANAFIGGSGNKTDKQASFATAGNGLIAAFSAIYLNTLLVSADGGATWVARTMPVTATSDTVGYATIHYLNNLWIATMYNGSAGFLYTSTDTITWTQRFTSAAFSTAYNGVYGTKYVIGLGQGSASSNILVSTDAVTWAFGTVPTQPSIVGLAYGGGKYVAAGGSTGAVNFIFTSTDAVTWTTITATGVCGSNVVHNGTAFLLASNYNTATFYRSTDAVTWTNPTQPASGSNYNFTVIGTTFYALPLPTGATVVQNLYGSTDGITWTAMNNMNTSYLASYSTTYGFTHRILPYGSHIVGLTANPYVNTSNYNFGSTPMPGAPAGLRIYVNGTNYGSIMTVSPPLIVPTYTYFVSSYSSPNNYTRLLDNSGKVFGHTSTAYTNAWTASSTSYTTTPFVCDAPNTAGFLILIASASTLYQYSTSEFGAAATTSLAGTWNAFVWANNLYLVGGAAGALYTYASTNTTWSSPTFVSRTSGFGANAIRAIAYGAGLYIIGGDNGSLSTSTDGTTWNSRTSGFGTTAIRVITGRPQANGQWLFVAAGDSGTLTTSTDGITWTVRSSGVTSSINTALPFTYTSSAYPVILGTSNGTIITPTSIDGSTWATRYITNESYTINASTSSNDGLTYYPTMATSTASYYLYSPINTGSTVADPSLESISLQINSVAYGNNLYLAAGLGGRLYTSTDTITWTARSLSTTLETITSVAYLNTTYVVGTLEGNIYTSTDGTTWTARTSGITIGYQINDLDYLNGKYYATYSNHVTKPSISNYAYMLGSQQGSTYSYQSSIWNQNYLGFTNFRSSDFTTGGIQQSTDLITWTAVTLATNSTQLGGINSIAYNGSSFITANGGGPNGQGSSFYAYNGSLASSLNYSANLSILNSNVYFNTAMGTAGVVDVSYNSTTGVICVVTNSRTTANIFTSTDSITWTSYFLPAANHLTSASFYAAYYYGNTGYNQYMECYSTPVSVNAGPGSTFIIATNAKQNKYSINAAQVAILNPSAGTLSTLTLPSEASVISTYNHNVAYNPSTGRVLIANKNGNLASGTINTTTTNTYYPSIFSLYSVNA